MLLEIFVSDVSERAEVEAIDKGYRNDVFVKLEVHYYRLNVYDSVRLQQDYQSEIESVGYYSIVDCIKPIHSMELEFISEENPEEIVFSSKYLGEMKLIRLAEVEV